LLEGRPLRVFFCRADKRPTCPHGFKDAAADADGIARLWSLYPGQLIGVPTGALNGIDAIDVDPRRSGHKWLSENVDRLPTTRVHETQRFGRHLIYQHSPGLRCSVDRIAPGVEVKADGGYIIWWPAHGCEVLCEAPVAAAPTWLLAAAVKSNRPHRVSREYHASDKTSQPTKNLSRRVARLVAPRRTPEEILRVVVQAKPGTRNAKLFWAACRFGEIVSESRLRQGDVEYLLQCAAEYCGLTHDDGERAVMATIASGLRTGANDG
jgi:hypothetical protein